MTMSVKTFILLCVLAVFANAYGEVVIERGDDGRGSNESMKQSNASAILPEKYIFGGKDAQVGAYPWIVRLEARKPVAKYSYVISNCGGSLVSDRHVLTAAHCIYKDGNFTIKQYNTLKIYLGEYNKTSYPEDCAGGKCVWNRLVYADRFFVHPHFNSSGNGNNDIALLRLKKRIKFTPSIQPIPLLPFDVDTPKFLGQPLVVAGWGVINEKFEWPSILQATVMKLMSKRRCSRRLRNQAHSAFCLVDIEGKKNTYSGDSGGPAVMYYRNKYYLAGVNSQGTNFTVVPNTPTISTFTNLFRHTKWITTHMDIV